MVANREITLASAPTNLPIAAALAADGAAGAGGRPSMTELLGAADTLGIGGAGGARTPG